MIDYGFIGIEVAAGKSVALWFVWRWVIWSTFVGLRRSWRVGRVWGGCVAVVVVGRCVASIISATGEDER